MPITKKRTWLLAVASVSVTATACMSGGEGNTFVGDVANPVDGGEAVGTRPNPVDGGVNPHPVGVVANPMDGGGDAGDAGDGGDGG